MNHERPRGKTLVCRRIVATEENFVETSQEESCSHSPELRSCRRLTLEAGPGPRQGLNTADCDEELHSGGWWWWWWWGHCTLDTRHRPRSLTQTNHHNPPNPWTQCGTQHSQTELCGKKHHQQYNFTTTQHDTIIAMPFQLPSNQSFLIYILSILCHLMGCHHHIFYCHANLHTDLCYSRFIVMV